MLVTVLSGLIEHCCEASGIQLTAAFISALLAVHLSVPFTACRSMADC